MAGLGAGYFASNHNLQIDVILANLPEKIGVGCFVTNNSSQINATGVNSTVRIGPIYLESSLNL